ncbi:hypothetical protein XI09_33290 [Bradyrhizobium sp. CCBAU 11386]|nr:hypothetical protein [Bradyrhizobium sp. CCBAU 11386]
MTEHVLAVLRNEEISILHVVGLEPEAASQSHIDTDHCYEFLCVVMRRGVNVIVNAPHVPSPLTRSAGLRRYFYFLTACDVAAGEAQHVFRRMRVDR